MFIIISTFFLIVVLFLIFWFVSLFWATISGPPIVFSSRKAILDGLELAHIKKDDLIIDLGCGNGKSLILAAKKFGAKGVGIDRSFFCYLRAKLYIWLAGESKNIKIIWGDFQKMQNLLKQADIVYLYLLDSTMAQIEPWLFKYVSTKTKIVSLAFKFPHHKPKMQIATFNFGKTIIWLYQK